MISHIRTSKENRELITQLTNKYQLGAENVIARLAIATSLKSGAVMYLDQIANSSGKEYSKDVLFGEHLAIYVGMICTKYAIGPMDKNVGRYLKMHLDDGIQFIANNELGFI